MRRNRKKAVKASKVKVGQRKSKGVSAAKTTKTKKLGTAWRKANKSVAVPFETCPELLLSTNVPKPLHGLAPRVVLGPAWWNKTRKEAYRSTDYHCLACGVAANEAQGRKWVEGHEVYSIDYAKGRAKYLKTVPLCHYCHNYIHNGRLQALLEKGEITHSKYSAIIRHGDSVLAKAGLHPSRKSTGQKTDVPWGKWRLVLFRRVYKPLYTEEEWRQRFGVSSLTELDTAEFDPDSH